MVCRVNGGKRKDCEGEVMITGQCRTNLDDYQGFIWPNMFSEFIQIGHWVESKSNDGSRKGCVRLRIVAITHMMIVNNGVERVYLEIELNK